MSSPFTTPFSCLYQNILCDALWLLFFHNNWDEAARDSKVSWKLQVVQPLKLNFNLICAERGEPPKLWQRIIYVNLISKSFVKFLLRRLSLNHLATLHKFVMENFYLKTKIIFHFFSWLCGWLVVKGRGMRGNSILVIDSGMNLKTVRVRIARDLKDKHANGKLIRVLIKSVFNRQTQLFTKEINFRVIKSPATMLLHHTAPLKG